MSSKRVRILKRRKTRYIHAVKMSIKRKELLCGFDVVLHPHILRVIRRTFLTIVFLNKQIKTPHNKVSFYYLKLKLLSMS